MNHTNAPSPTARNAKHKRSKIVFRTAFNTQRSQIDEASDSIKDMDLKSATELKVAPSNAAKSIDKSLEEKDNSRLDYTLNIRSLNTGLGHCHDMWLTPG